MAMQDWEELQTIFSSGLHLNLLERESLLVDHPPELAEAVRELWASHDSADGFLEGTAVPIGLRHMLDTGQFIAGRFCVLDLIGSGGMGEVYKARDEQLDRIVALKTLSPASLNWPDALGRLETEARAICRLNHPRICALHDIVWEDRVPILVMEYLEGETLAARLARGPLDLPDLLRIAGEIAEGLAYAHKKSIVHRDLKPGNVMLTQTGAKLLDFGIATGLGQQVPENDLVIGSAGYMSPEQAAGKPVDARSDIFSFGAVLYEMATCQRAFRRDSTASTLIAVLERRSDDAQSLMPDVPARLLKLIERCLSEIPAERYGSAEDVTLAIRALQEPKQRIRRRFWLTAFQVGLAVVSLGGGLSWWSAPHQTPTTTPHLRHMIDDDAYCIFPDLSPDGKLLVYSSDRAGSLDLWLQPVSGGSPIKLTDDSGNEDEAVFSPDGREIAYQSEQDGGGVFIIPVSGGSSREIARNGNHPTYSPDGRYIAYWEGDATSPTVRANTRVFIRPTTDGPARQVAIDVAGAQRPVFSADSKRILVERFDGEPARESVIFCAPLDGGPSIRTHIGEDLRRQQLSYPQVHYWGVNVLVVTATSGDIQGVWKVPFDSTRLAVTGKATSLALGTESSAFPKVRGSKMVFHGGTFSYNVWTLPLQADRVSAIGTPHRATGKVGRAVMPELAPDGRRLAYSYFPSLVATRSAGLETFLRDFDTGSEWLFTPSRTPAWAPHFFGDNNHLITTTGTEASRSVYETSATGGESIKLSDDCENASPSPSGRWLICQSTSGERLTALKISGRDRKEILSDGNSMMWGVRISPDENWITWVSTNKNSGLSQILVAPYRGQSVISRDEWVEVTRDESWFGYPAWSPAGNVIYYLSDRDGHRCIYAQRLRKGTKHPDGHPIAVYHYHGTQRLEWISQNWQNLSVAADKIAFLQPESKFTIWMADLAQDPN